MKGFIDENGYDRPACIICKHKHKRTVEAPCCNCISLFDLARHKPNYETDFTSFEPEQQRSKAITHT